MHNNIENLINILETEYKIYNDVNLLSKKKTEVIVGGKVNELENIVKAEQLLLQQIMKLEENRENIIFEIASSFSQPPEELSISKIIELYQDKDSEITNRLKSCYNVMQNVLNEVQSNNDLNNKLIKSSLEYIDFSLNLATNIRAVGNNYGESGKTNEAKKRNFIDLKY